MTPTRVVAERSRARHTTRTPVVGERGRARAGADRRRPVIAHVEGQATVELIAVLPLVIAAALAAAAIVAHAAAVEHAGEAAQAGAMALAQDEDARDAARAALPDGERGAATITVAGRTVTVSLPPSTPLRALLPGLEASARADAGPEPAP